MLRKEECEKKLTRHGSVVLLIHQIRKCCKNLSSKSLSMYKLRLCCANEILFSKHLSKPREIDGCRSAESGVPSVTIPESGRIN